MLIFFRKYKKLPSNRVVTYVPALEDDGWDLFKDLRGEACLFEDLLLSFLFCFFLSAGGGSRSAAKSMPDRG